MFSRINLSNNKNIKSYNLFIIKKQGKNLNLEINY